MHLAKYRQCAWAAEMCGCKVDEIRVVVVAAAAAALGAAVVSDRFTTLIESPMAMSHFDLVAIVVIIVI